MNPNKEVKKSSCQVRRRNNCVYICAYTCKCVGDIKDWLDLGTKGCPRVLKSKGEIASG